MKYYMFGMDSENPEQCAKRLSDIGFSMVVCEPNRRTIDAVRSNGMEAYACVGAFPLSNGRRKCIDVDGKDRVWFSSGCPNDRQAQAEHDEEIRSICAVEGLSGVFIDGARFASPASEEGIEGLFTCFCDDCRKEMSEPDKMLADVRAWRDGKAVLPPEAWLDFRKICVTRAMRHFAEMVHEVDSKLKAGAFVFAPSLGRLVGQTRECYDCLDVVAPMLYRKYRAQSGPATLNFEYDAMIKQFGYGRTKLLTGVNAPENVLTEGFLPNQVEIETRNCGAKEVWPIIQLDDELLSESIQSAINGGANSIGFFMYGMVPLDCLQKLN